MATTKKSSKIAPVLMAIAKVKAPVIAPAAEVVSPIEVPSKVVTPSRGLGIGALVKELITQGFNNDEILERVRTEFPSASTNKACVSWYRSDMKKRAAKV
jgi:hypothetical protein